MNTTTRTLALTLAAIAGTTTIHTATAAATPNCTGTAAITNLTITITDNTYTAHWTPTSRCADTPITIAAHDTAHLTWDPTETQPLIDSHTATAADGTLGWTLPAGVAPRCRLQLDLVTGPALDVVDAAHRYNEYAIGGGRSRLIDARYTDTLCDFPPATTTVTEPPATSVTSTPETPTSVTWVTPMPTQPGGEPPVTEPTTDVALTPDPTPYTAVPRLPETGANAWDLVQAAAWLFFAGGSMLLACLPLRRRTQNVPTRNPESE